MYLAAALGSIGGIAVPATVSGSETPAAQHAVASVESSTSGTLTSGAPVAASSSFGALEPMRQVQGLVGAALVLTALGAGLMMLSKTSTSKAKRATRKKVIEAAEADLEPADELSIAVADIEAAENEGTVKVRVASHRCKTWRSLCACVWMGAALGHVGAYGARATRAYAAPLAGGLHVHVQL